jgi:hypothetical protein
MSDFNQPTRRQDEQEPSTTPPSGQQTRQTQHGSIERNPDADEAADVKERVDTNDDVFIAVDPQRQPHD